MGDQDTTLEATTEAGMVMTTGDTQVLTRLGRADQDTGLLVTHSPRMFHVLLVLPESQARPRVARPRVARQRRPQQRVVTNFLSGLFASLKNLDWLNEPLHSHESASKNVGKVMLIH